MRSWLVMPIALFSLLAASGCEQDHSCTLIGCRSNDYQLVREWAPGDYEVELSYTLGGDFAFTCALRIEGNDDDDAGEIGHPQGVCTQTEGDQRSVALHVLSGEVTLSLYDSPDSFQLDVSRDGESLAHETVTPQYAVTYPNGPDCGECRNVTLSIAVE